MDNMRELERQSIVPFEKLPNFRDLGGYPIVGGGTTNRGKFYRAPGLSDMTAADKRRMLELGVRLVVDLRTADEVRRRPNPFDEGDGIIQLNVPLIDSLHSGSQAAVNMTLGDLYIYLIDKRGDGLRQVFAAFAQHVGEGACVFHCSAGKDRTGVVAALLLLLAGVGEEDVIANYAISAQLMRPVFEQLSAWAEKTGIQNSSASVEAFGSDAINLHRFIEHLKAHYGTARDYLLGIGLSAGEVDTLYGALVSTGD